ncbi:MAG: hypothetical protein H0Z24_09070 [Thermosipho sp. (in: Bacteria)]|nr:hypothetical protein [Thermosipho sp. (in: thermotogales)]
MRLIWTILLIGLLIPFASASMITVTLQGDEIHIYVNDEKITKVMVNGELSCKGGLGIIAYKVFKNDEDFIPLNCYLYPNGTIDFSYKIKNIDSVENIITTPLIRLKSHVPIIIVKEVQRDGWYYVLYDDLLTEFLGDWIPPVSYLKIPVESKNDVTLLILTNAEKVYVGSTKEIEVKGDFSKTTTENGTVYSGRITEFKPTKYFFVKYDKACYKVEERKSIIGSTSYVVVKRKKDVCDVYPEIGKEQFNGVSKVIIAYDDSILTQVKVFIKTNTYVTGIAIGIVFIILALVVSKSKEE